MAKCVKCFDFYHPDFITKKNIRGDMVNICLFCNFELDKLTIVDEDDKIVETVEKKQASINYKKWLDDLSKKPEIAKVISETKQKRYKIENR